MITKVNDLGLALGGGAVLGAAHIGVLKRLEELGVKPEYVSGTSIGALIAAFYAFGKTAHEIESFTHELKWKEITRITFSRFGLLSNEKLGELLISHLGEQNIEDALIPLAIVATDVTSGEKFVLKKGPLKEAVMPSTAIPGNFKPVEIGDRLLVDGGIVENVPVRTARDMGAEFVIGVDLNAKHEYDRPVNLLDVIMNSFHFTMQNMARLQAGDADLLIQPNLSGFKRSSMKNLDELIERGYKEACIKLSEKKAPPSLAQRFRNIFRKDASGKRNAS